MMADTSPADPRETTTSALEHAQTAPAADEQGTLPRTSMEPGRVQEAQQEYEKYYHDLVAGSLQGIGILHRDGIIQVVNPVLATLFGYANPDDLCGRAMGTLLAPHEQAAWEEHLHACVREHWTAHRHTIQGIQGIQGPAGTSGTGTDEVWIGATEPVDSAIELWYDTDAVPSGVPSWRAIRHRHHATRAIVDTGVIPRT